MIDEKRLKAAQILVPQLMSEGIIRKDEKYKNLAGFYLDNMKLTLETSQLLFKASTSSEAKEKNNLDKEFQTHLWVINTVYYSMFYASNALLASHGIKIDTERSIHSITLNALIYFFLLTKKLSEKMIEEFEDAQSESTGLLGVEDKEGKIMERARCFIEKYESEKNKRSLFTYETSIGLKQAKAKTSLERAQEFIKYIKIMIK